MSCTDCAAGDCQQPAGHTTEQQPQAAPYAIVEVTAEEWPECDICQITGKPPANAYADVNIPTMSTWGNVCKNHFDIHHCRLGLGFGQQYVLKQQA
jgi:hypothetical protein